MKNEKHYETADEKARRHLTEALAMLDRSGKMIGRTAAQQCYSGAASHSVTAVAALKECFRQENGGAFWGGAAVIKETKRFRRWITHTPDGKELANPGFGEWEFEKSRKAAK